MNEDNKDADAGQIDEQAKRIILQLFKPSN